MGLKRNGWPDQDFPRTTRGRRLNSPWMERALWPNLLANAMAAYQDYPDVREAL